MEKFKEERVRINNFEVHEVEGDGGCLFRCLANGLFHSLNQDLREIKRKFKLVKGYRKDFLENYLDIRDCLMVKDYVLDDEIEEEIAKELQYLILEFIRRNPNLKVSKFLPSYQGILEEDNLKNLVKICHELSLKEYLETYKIWAGEEDVIYKDGKELEISERWGGIPELLVFSIIFDLTINIYLPQMFKNEKIIDTYELNENTYLLKIDVVNPNKKEINLVFKSIGHYDFLKKLI